MRLRLGQISVTAMFAAVLLVAGCGTGIPEQVSSDTSEPDMADKDVVANQLVALVKPGTTAGEIAALWTEAGATQRESLDSLSAYLVEFDPDQRSSVRAALEASLAIEGVLDNRYLEAQFVPTDSLYQEQYHHVTVNSEAAWDVTIGSDEIVVAVLDTGVDTSHPDLAGRLLSGGNTNGGGGWQDIHGHGTAVAGVIGASSNDNRGVTGMTWFCPMIPIRVTNDEGRTTSWAIASGIALAMSRGAEVINISFAPLQDNAIVLRQARMARLAGSLVVISAGNTGEQVVQDSTAYNASVLFVSATEPDDQLASFSTYGDFVDITAPGRSIQTTRMGGSYGGLSGTSFSAPIVSSVAALAWSTNPSLRASTIEQILLVTARDLGESGYDMAFGAGLVDAYEAVRLAAEISEVEDDELPAVNILRPSDGDRVEGATTLEVLAEDNLDVADVTVRVDGVKLATDASAPYLIYLDGDRFTHGEHVITVVATDVSGNLAVDTIRVVMGQAQDEQQPSVVITQPRAGERVQGVVTVVAQATDDVGLASAELLVDGEVYQTVSATGTEAALAFSWDASSSATGDRILTVRAVDQVGRAGSSAVRVEVRQ